MPNVSLFLLLFFYSKYGFLGEKGCCSVHEMLEEFLDSQTLKYSYNLSLTFYKAFTSLSEFYHHLNPQRLCNFHCILSLFRARLNKCPQSFELLDAEIRKWSSS